MAAKQAGKKKTAAKSRKGTAKGGSRQTNGKNRAKESGSSDLVTKLLLVGALVIAVVLLLQFFKEGNGEKKPTGTPTPVLTPTTEPVKTPTPALTPTDTPSAAPSAMPTPAPTAEQTPEPTKEPEVTAEEAERIIEKAVDTALYRISLLNDHLILDDGQDYFMFLISDAKGTDMEPLLLVDKKTGAIKCYTTEGVLSDFSVFPLDNAEPAKPSKSEISKEEAFALLSGLNREILGLAKELSEYDEITYDDWTTMANGVSCYGINIFETVNGKPRFRGTFYVAVDGSRMYRLDSETNDFIELQ